MSIRQTYPGSWTFSLRPAAVTGAVGEFAPAHPRCGLTPRQLDALRFIQGYQIAHDGISPSMAEIGAALNLRSKGGVARLVDGLEERGWLRRKMYHARAIRLLHSVPVPTAPDGAPLYFVPVAALPIFHGANNA